MGSGWRMLAEARHSIDFTNLILREDVFGAGSTATSAGSRYWLRVADRLPGFAPVF